MKKIIFICLFFTASIFTSHAQLFFFNYTDPNQITTIEEDGSYFWAGTNGGLYKWFKSGSGLIGKYHILNGLPSNFVYYIKKDHFYNELWVCTGNGIAVLNVLNEWKIYNTENGLPSNVVKSLAIDLSGNKWFATYNGVTMYNPVKKTWTNYTVKDGLAEYHCEAINIDYKGNVWVGTWNGVSMFDGIKWSTFKTGDGLVNNRITSIATDVKTGNVWFGSITGISKYNGLKFTNYKEADGLISNSVNSIAVDASGFVWIATSFGVSRFDGVTGWTDYEAATGKLASNKVFVVNMDSEQNTWFGNIGGVSKLSHDGTTWVNYYTGEGLIDNKIEAIAGNSGNSIWIGTQDGVSVYDEKHWTSIGSEKLAASFVYDVALDAKGGAYIATIKGLNYSKDTVFKTYKKDSGLISNIVTAVAVEKNGLVWCGTDSGVSVYNGSKWTSFNVDSGLNNNTINDIAIDKQNVKWFATPTGVTSYNGSIWKKYSTSNGLLDSNVLVIGIDTLGNKWFGTNGGLSVYNGTTWKNYTTADGLADNVVQSIAFDKQANPWVGTANGISYFNGKKWVSYTDADGLAHPDVKAIFIGADDTKWIGTIGGLSKANCQIPAVDFTADTACLPGITTFKNTSTLVNTGTIFSWDINANDTSEYFTSNITHQFTKPGIFKVKLTESNMLCSASVLHNVAVRVKPVANILPLSATTICSGSSVSLQASIANFYDSADYHYFWSNGSKLKMIKADSSKSYNLIVKDGNCTSTRDTQNVSVRFPFHNEVICMVTVDKVSNKNLVIWHKTPDEGIASYNIYKIIGNKYSLIGNLGYNELSVFEDITSQPSVKSERYAITVVDTCGNESDYSPYHQSINVGSSVGTKPGSAVLNWNHYVDESGIYKPDFYYIFKGKTPNSMSLVDSVSGFVTLYNDSDGAYYYFVGARKNPICNPANLKIKEGPYSMSISNLEDNRMKADSVSLSQNIISSFSVSPNPFCQYLTVDYSLNNTSKVQIELYDLLGSKIQDLLFEKQNNGVHQSTFNVETLKSGIYLLKITTDNDKIIEKIIKFDQ